MSIYIYPAHKEAQYYPSPTIQNLTRELVRNHSQVNRDLSYFYWIALKTPVKISEIQWDHTCILEQFLREDLQEVGIRIHHSWIKTDSVLDSIQKRGYGSKGENSWDLQKALAFIKKLNSLYSYDRTTTFRECFDLGLDEPIKFLACFLEDTLLGKSIIYYSSSVNPKDCLNNLAEFILSNSVQEILEESL